MFSRKWTILALATLATVHSTGLVAVALLAASWLLGLGISLPWCLVFGALISPTDPVSVLDVLKRVGIPRQLEATVAGESLFNDGIGVVVFTLMLSLATSHQSDDFAAGTIACLFLLEAVGGGLLGLGLGYLAFLMIQRVDDYNVELIISLALASGTYSAAGLLGVSGPIAVVVAGILIGNYGMDRAMSETTRQHLMTFWRLVGEILNAILFLMIGLHIAAVDLDRRNIIAVVAMIPTVLVIRWLSVFASAMPLNLHLPRRYRSLVILTWGGLRGGLSIAMALSLPDGPSNVLWRVTPTEFCPDIAKCLPLSKPSSAPFSSSSSASASATKLRHLRRPSDQRLRGSRFSRRGRNPCPDCQGQHPPNRNLLRLERQTR